MLADRTEWEPFIERQDMLIWRREDLDGQYAYKVYGRFEDVSADDFFQVQIDTEYRKKWDSTVMKLDIVDSDPKYASSHDNSNDVIYWEMKWPVSQEGQFITLLYCNKFIKIF